MTIYTFHADGNHYRNYLWATEHDLELLRTVRGQPLGSGWSPARVYADKRDRRLPLGDHPGLYLGSGVPALSERAVELLRELLLPVGELLPLICEDQPLWLFNCTHIADVLDEEASVFKADAEGTIYWFERFAWRPEAEDQAFFRLPRTTVNATYLSERVAQIIRASDLRGFDLRPTP
ncbi:MAG: hypothetical protein HC927_06440 [Deltaproteobacteria bacterium]|nr:hypothetical protein [Deltaproteobacteria bacterium]